MSDLFSVTARVEGEIAVITPVGEFDLAATDDFYACAQPLLQTVQTVVVDLREVSFLDSSGLNALLTFRQSASAVGRKLTLRAPSDRVRRLLVLAGVTDILPIEP